MILLLLGATIEGTVTDPTGAPVENARLAIYDRRFRLADPVFTDANGAWSHETEADYVRVRVLPPDVTTGSEFWFGDTLRVCESPRVVPGTSEPVDVQLPAGGTLQGTLFWDEDEAIPYEGAVVEVFPVWQQEVSVSTRRGTVDETGAFVVTGLPPDDPQTGFIVQIAADLGPLQFSPGVHTLAEAEPVRVPDGGVVEGFSFPVLTGTHVSGTVLGPNGPVQDATVSVVNSRGQVATTDADGAFLVEGMPPGPATLVAGATGLSFTGLGDIAGPGTPVEIEDVPVEGLQITLQPEARVTGILPALVTEEAGGGIRAIGVDGGHTLGLVSSDGSFVFAGLFPGTYSFEVYAVESVNLLAGAALKDGVPVQITVEAGEEVDLGTLTARRAATLTGTVFDDFGDPVRGAAIIVQSTVRFVTFSDDTGTFAMRGIPPGSYDLQAGHGTFCSGDPTFVSVYWPEQVNPHVRRNVELTEGEVVTWDTVMPLDDDGDGLSDAWEAEHGFEIGPDESAEDPDRDGFSNLEEYHLGTDPNEFYKKEGCGACAAGFSFAWPRRW